MGLRIRVLQTPHRKLYRHRKQSIQGKETKTYMNQKTLQLITAQVHRLLNDRCTKAEIDDLKAMLAILHRMEKRKSMHPKFKATATFIEARQAIWAWRKDYKPILQQASDEVLDGLDLVEEFLTTRILQEQEN